MPFIAGTGGAIFVTNAAGRQDVSEWSIEAGDRLADGTTSANTGADYFSTLEDHSWSASLPVDTANTPYSDNLYPGQRVTIFFRVGNGATYHRLTNTTIASVGVQNPNTGELHRNTISGRGGTMIWYGAAPA
jgi:hypothetical protein